MTWYAWAVIGYIAVDRLLTIAWIGRTLEVTKATAILSMLTGVLGVWAIVELAGRAAA